VTESNRVVKEDLINKVSCQQSLGENERGSTIGIWEQRKKLKQRFLGRYLFDMFKLQ
jgi:hypothetical protein